MSAAVGATRQTGQMRSRPRSSTHGIVIASLATLGLLAGSGCSGNDETGDDSSVETSPTTTIGGPERSDADSGRDTTTATSTTITTVTTEPPSSSTVVAAPTIATVPEGGVPGIDSADAFCRSWSEFAGSFQALALASAVDPDPVAGARLEVVASPAVDRAAAALSESFPGEIADERPVFLDGVVGPFAGRSSLAGEELLTAGFTFDERNELVVLWLEALVAEQPVVAVTVPDELDDVVDAAAATFRRGGCHRSPRTRASSPTPRRRRRSPTSPRTAPTRASSAAPTPSADAFLLRAMSFGDDGCR